MNVRDNDVTWWMNEGRQTDNPCNGERMRETADGQGESAHAIQPSRATNIHHANTKSYTLDIASHGVCHCAIHTDLRLFGVRHQE